MISSDSRRLRDTLNGGIFNDLNRTPTAFQFEIKFEIGLRAEDCVRTGTAAIPEPLPSHLFHFAHQTHTDSDYESDYYGERGDANQHRLSPCALEDFVDHFEGCAFVCASKLERSEFDKMIL